MKDMLSHETFGETEVITILDDAGRDADLEIHFKDYGPNVTLRQSDATLGGDDVIVLTPLQAALLMDVLANIIGDDGDNDGAALH